MPLTEDAQSALLRLSAGVEIHDPVRVCVAHHQQHECPQPDGYLWRCYECAKTRALPCRTWRALTGKERPDEHSG